MNVYKVLDLKRALYFLHREEDPYSTIFSGKSLESNGDAAHGKVS